MKRYRFWIILLVIILVGGIVFDSVAAVKPSMPLLREGDPDHQVIAYIKLMKIWLNAPTNFKGENNANRTE